MAFNFIIIVITKIIAIITLMRQLSPAQINTRKSDIFNFMRNKGPRFITSEKIVLHFDYTDQSMIAYNDSRTPAREALHTGSKQGGFMQHCTPGVQIKPWLEKCTQITSTAQNCSACPTSSSETQRWHQTISPSAFSCHQPSLFLCLHIWQQSSSLLLILQALALLATSYAWDSCHQILPENYMLHKTLLTAEKTSRAFRNSWTSGTECVTGEGAVSNSDDTNLDLHQERNMTHQQQQPAGKADT